MTTFTHRKRELGKRDLTRGLVYLTATISLVACTVGPDYHRPAVEAPADFKESQGWQPASPAQVASDVAWWDMYHDPVLDQLEKQVEISNQNLKQAEAQYRAARAEVGIARGALLPDIGVTASAGQSNRGGGSSTGGATAGTGSGTVSNFSIVGQGSWDLDLWGRIRRTIEGDVDTAQASAADVAAAKLSAQTLIAEDYFQMRAAEAQQTLLAQAVKDFQDALQIAKNREAAGTATEADVAEAQTEVDTASTQEVSTALTRAKMEHAIAMLTGKAPAEVNITTVGKIATTVPVAPPGISTTLLQRRPDIAGAERRAAAANANIGVAVAAWFPDITLSGSYGFASTALGALFSASSATWAYGASAVETIFNGGARSAQVQQAHANYEAAVALYRQTSLAAFQQVEDDLASLRILEREGAMADTTVIDARRAEQLTLNQYKAGIVDYTTVVTAQTTRVNAEVSALAVLSQRLVASVDLVDALGGGWDAKELPQTGGFYSLPKTLESQASTTP